MDKFQNATKQQCIAEVDTNWNEAKWVGRSKFEQMVHHVSAISSE